MNTDIQDALLKSASIIVDEKIKKLDYNYYFDARVIDTSSKDNALVYTIARNPVYCSETENKYNKSGLYEDEIRLIKNGTDVIGYYASVFTDVRARAGLYCSVGDSVGVLVKNGDLKQKMIDDCPSNNASANVKTYSQVGGSLYPSLDITLNEVGVHTDTNGIPYGQARFSWSVNTADPFHTLGGFSLIICQGEVPPCISKDTCINYSSTSTSGIVDDTYHIIEQGKTYTAFLVAKDVYGNYMQAVSSSAMKKFTLPEEPYTPPTPVVPEGYPSWYTTDYMNDASDYNAFSITGNFANNDNLVEITNQQLKNAICLCTGHGYEDDNYVMQPYANFRTFGIEYNTPNFNWGTLWKNSNYHKSFIYIQRGEYSAPYAGMTVPELDESDTEWGEECLKHFYDNCYSKIDCTHNRNYINQIYNSFNRESNAYDENDEEDLDSTYYHIVSQSTIKLPYLRNEDSTPIAWRPSETYVSRDARDDLEYGNNETFMGLVMGMDINGNQNPHKCVAFVYGFDFNDDYQMVFYDKNAINTNYNRQWTMSYYEGGGTTTNTINTEEESEK